MEIKKVSLVHPGHAHAASSLFLILPSSHLHLSRSVRRPTNPNSHTTAHRWGCARSEHVRCCMQEANDIGHPSPFSPSMDQDRRECRTCIRAVLHNNSHTTLPLPHVAWLEGNITTTSTNYYFFNSPFSLHATTFALLFLLLHIFPSPPFPFLRHTLVCLAHLTDDY